MNYTPKTIGFVLVAAALCAIAVFTAPKNVNDELFSDLGTEFYPDFKDALKATTLEVIGMDEKQGKMIPFKVALKDGRWVIPSYSNYPTDVKDKMEHTAVKLLGLTRDELRSSLPSDHEALGVIDPDKGIPTGAGIRVTLKDSDGNKLCDYIVGQQVEGKSGFIYLRTPGQSKTYAVKADLEISTKFSDWIETGLLDMQSADVKELTINDYSVTQGQLVQKGQFLLNRDKEQKWNTEKVPEGKELDQEKANSVISEIANLKLASVRKKPDSLIQILSGKTNQLTPEAQISLQSNGFYLNDGGIVGDEGQFVVVKNNGVAYIIIFGVGFNDDSIQIGSDKKNDKSVSGRYTFITAQYDASINPEPKVSEKPKEIETPTPDQKKEYEKLLDVWNKTTADHEAWAKTKKEADEEVKTLKSRFNEWYYVVDNESYKKMKVTLVDLVKDKEKKEDKKSNSPVPNFQLPQLKQ